MKITSWNINGIKARLPIVLDWLKQNKPDIVGLQEIKCLAENFPKQEFEDLGYNVEVFGQKSFNGVALLSKFPFDEVKRGLGGDKGDEQARLIEGVFSTKTGVVRVCNIYAPNGNPVYNSKGGGVGEAAAGCDGDNIKGGGVGEAAAGCDSDNINGGSASELSAEQSQLGVSFSGGSAKREVSESAQSVWRECKKENYSDKFIYKLKWMDRLIEFAKNRLKFEEPFILMGDFNIIPSKLDVHDPKAWWGDALYREESLEKFRILKNLGFIDGVRTTSSEPNYSFWDYQGGAWRKNNGIRIDHLMLSAQAADLLISIKTHRSVRGWERPSDHIPIEGRFLCEPDL